MQTRMNENNVRVKGSAQGRFTDTPKKKENRKGRVDTCGGKGRKRVSYQRERKKPGESLASTEGGPGRRNVIGKKNHWAESGETEKRRESLPNILKKRGDGGKRSLITLAMVR